MTTPLNRITEAWSKDDPLALHREVERLAAEGHSRQTLEDAMEALLLAVRATGADDDTEELINGVWDRLTGWCQGSRRIRTLENEEKKTSVDSPVDGKLPVPLSTPSALR